MACTLFEMELRPFNDLQNACESRSIAQGHVRSPLHAKLLVIFLMASIAMVTAVAASCVAKPWCRGHGIPMTHALALPTVTGSAPPTPSSTRRTVHRTSADPEHLPHSPSGPVTGHSHGAGHSHPPVVRPSAPAVDSRTVKGHGPEVRLGSQAPVLRHSGLLLLPFGAVGGLLWALTFRGRAALLFPGRTRGLMQPPRLPNSQLALMAASSDRPGARRRDSDGGPECSVQLHYVKALAAEAGSLAEYVRLPASEYRLLDSNQLFRIDDDRFRVVFGDLRVLGLLRVRSFADVSVEVGEARTVQRLRRIQFEGTPRRLIDAMNTLHLGTTWANEISALPRDNGLSDLESAVRVDWALPRGYPARPAVMRAVVTRLMDFTMPWLLDKLADDYRRWRSGSRDRATVTGGALSRLTAEFISQKRNSVKLEAEPDTETVNNARP